MLKILTTIDDFMYYPVLIIVMAAAGLYFTVRTRFVQLRLLKEACRLIMEKPEDKEHVSSFQALIRWARIVIHADPQVTYRADPQVTYRPSR